MDDPKAGIVHAAKNTAARQNESPCTKVLFYGKQSWGAMDNGENRLVHIWLGCRFHSSVLRWI
jgi:hypothetical protein